eukprot:1501718-Rhodomonas_salina.1
MGGPSVSRLVSVSMVSVCDLPQTHERNWSRRSHIEKARFHPFSDSGRKGTPPLQSVSLLQSTRAVRGNHPPSTVL